MRTKALFAVVVALAPAAAKADGVPQCRFIYSEQLRNAVIAPEVARLAPRMAQSYDTTKPHVAIKDGVVHLKFEPGIGTIDGKALIILLDPCTGKITASRAADDFMDPDGD